MNGDYLICPSDDLADRLIYLLMDIDGDLCGICVNKEFLPPRASWETPPMFDVAKLLMWYQQLGCVKNHRQSLLPTLDGGESKRGIFALHNAFTAANETHPIAKMYSVSLLEDFFEGMKGQPKPVLFQIVNGYKIFDQSELKKNINNGTWKLRKGLHAMAYGTNLANKLRFIDFLSEEKPSDFKTGGFDMGSFMNDLMKLVKEFQPSLMHASVSRHLQATDPESSYEVHLKVLRLMIAVAETEGNDVIKVMKKYTHAEITKLYDGAIEGGFNFNLLDEFDRRYAMLEDLGLVPLMYDTITTEIFLGMDKSKLKDAPRSGRLSGLEDTIRKVAGIVKAREASGEKG